MRTLIMTLIIVVVTLALLVGGAFLLAEPQAPAPLPEPTVPETTAPPETAAAEPTVPVQTEAPKMTVDAVPRYYQTDYPNVKFGNGTISTSGCSVTCLAMVATYLTDQEYLPDQMAYHFGSYGKNHVQRLEYGNAQMRLPNVRTDNVQDVLAGLREGKVAIAMMDYESLFTTTQHFIVMAGLTEDGKVVVNDPLESTHWEDVFMVKCYDEGFPESNVIKGFCGAWIYDKKDIPSEYIPFDASTPEQQESRYAGYVLTDEDNYYLASFLWAEARNESEEVQQAIAEVILNRVVSDKFPNTVSDVIRKGEYSGNCQKMPFAEVGMPQYRAVTAAMFGPHILPDTVHYFSIWETHGTPWGTVGPYTFLYSREKPTEQTNGGA